MAEWYYVGHYGQLGPLTTDQMVELVEGGVITQETYVWKSGMANWQLARDVAELRSTLQASMPFAPPPPPPMAPDPRSSLPPSVSSAQPMQPYDPYSAYNRPVFTGLRSDRSRIAAGILQLLLPGVGRLYLGYYAIGVLQIVLSIVTCGVLIVWPFFDGIVILCSGVRYDGFGRLLGD